MNPRDVSLAGLLPVGQEPRALCHGLVASDILVRTSFPVPRDVKVRADSLGRQGGGPAANSAVALARLGMPVSFVGGVGDDSLGQEQLDELKREGVDVSGASVIRGTPSFVSIILVDSSDGSRTIYNAPADRPLLPDGAPTLPGNHPHIVLIDGWGGEHQFRLAQDARRAGIPVLLDAGSLRDATRRLLPLCDVVIASKPFSDAFTEPGREAETVHQMLAEGARLAAVTRGEQGVVAGAQGSSVVFEVPAERVNAVDTTGAGDAFHAGAAWGLAQGWSWIRSLRVGAWVAGRKCEHPGARAGLPRRAEMARTSDLLTGTE